MDLPAEIEDDIRRILSFITSVAIGAAHMLAMLMAERRAIAGSIPDRPYYHGSRIIVEVAWWRSPYGTNSPWLK
jgi:hypothetical protein